jgi:tetratricopeptide (TPR) repeat protein
MLETVRAFAARELVASGEDDEAMEGLVRYAAGEAALAVEGLVGPAQVEWLDRVREDLESYRSALAWLIERGRSREAADITSALMFFWLIRGHAAEGRRWYEQILELPALPPSTHCKTLLGAALMAFSQGELDNARRTVTLALGIASGTGDDAVVAQCEILFGYVEHATGNMTEAGEHFSRSLELFRTLPLPWGAGNALNGLARVALATGDSEQAERLLLEATGLLRNAGPWFLALTLSGRGNLAVRRGQADEAIAAVRECLTHIRALHDKYAFAYVLVSLAGAAILKGDYAWAARVLGARDAAARAGAPVIDRHVEELRTRFEGEVRARLDPVRWAIAYSAGKSASIDALLRDIDSAV